ncbi:MAG: hypothetical protein M3N33_08375 [Actinomycetota bacterium]|nr:hypothetical protein [Actinomycetota bacterium]
MDTALQTAAVNRRLQRVRRAGEKLQADLTRAVQACGAGGHVLPPPNGTGQAVLALLAIEPSAAAQQRATLNVPLPDQQERRHCEKGGLVDGLASGAVGEGSVGV